MALINPTVGKGRLFAKCLLMLKLILLKSGSLIKATMTILPRSAVSTTGEEGTLCCVHSGSCFPWYLLVFSNCLWTVSTVRLAGLS